MRIAQHTCPLPPQGTRQVLREHVAPGAVQGVAPRQQVWPVAPQHSLPTHAPAHWLPQRPQ